MNQKLPFRVLAICLTAVLLLSGCVGAEDYHEESEQGDSLLSAVSDGLSKVEENVKLIRSTEAAELKRTEALKQSDETNPADETETASPWDLHFFSLCAKEATEENRIYFNYPQLLKSEDNADRINDLIVEFVELALQDLYDNSRLFTGNPEYSVFAGNLKDSPESWTWNGSDYSIMAAKIDYSIERYDSDYLSVTFNGLHNFRTAAHPNHRSYSLTIDLRTCEVVALSDLYLVDAEFAVLVKETFRQQALIAASEWLELPPEEIHSSFIRQFPNISDLDLAKALSQGNDHGFAWFLTDTSLGISVPLSPSSNTHYAVYIDFEKLEHFKR